MRPSARARQTLPNTVTITTNRLTFATFPILGYSLTSDRLSQTQLWELATYQLKPPLNRATGVSTVTVQGGKVPEFHIVPDMARMQTAGITILDLVNAVQASNIIDSPGLYEANHQLILGLVGAQAHDAEQLGRLSGQDNNSRNRCPGLRCGDGTEPECCRYTRQSRRMEMPRSF